LRRRFARGYRINGFVNWCAVRHKRAIVVFIATRIIHGAARIMTVAVECTRGDSWIAGRGGVRQAGEGVVPNRDVAAFRVGVCVEYPGAYLTVVNVGQALTDVAGRRNVTLL
jgi:hypothetical protein